MSFEDGWAAINLQMPKRVPRTELSITEYHWELMRTVTGIRADGKSAEEEKMEAARAFMKAWDYDLFLSSLVGGRDLVPFVSYMGHAVYAEDGSDYKEPSEPLFRKPEEALAFDPWEAYGEIDKKQFCRKFEEHYKQRCALFPTNVNTTGIYVSLVTGLTYNLGWEMLLLAAGTDPEGFGELVNRYASWMQQYYDALAEAQIEGGAIFSHDDMVWTEGAIFHPDWYRKYIFPNYRRFWDPLRESGKKILFICDGNYTQFIDDIAACGNHGFWFEIFTDLEALAERYGKTHFLVGNADTRVLLSGDKDKIRAEVKRCLDVGRNCPGYFMSVTNHIPANTPIESALYYNEVYEELCWR
jgi:uroporphyrinogen-III decarboxylase